MAKQEKHKDVSIQNRKAHHEYHIDETYEAGIVLSGTEVKSLRAGQASITEAYCKIENNEVWIYGMHISPYEQGNRFNLEPLRQRKLLLRSEQIAKFQRQLKEKGFTLVPLKVYFTRGYAKVLIGLARGKKVYDKRDAIAERDIERDRRREESGKY